MPSIWSRRYFIASTLAMAGGIRAEEARALMLLAGDAGYEKAREPFNSVVKLRPAVIAACRSEADVVEGVRHAAARNLPIAVKSGAIPSTAIRSMRGEW